MRAWIVGGVVVVSLFGCSQVVQRLTIYSMGDMMAAGQRVYERETDLELATQSLGANLKTLELMLELAPRDASLLFHAAQGFGAYAYAVPEGHLAEPQRYTAAEIEAHTRRAQALYRRGLQYGLRLMSREQADWLQASDLDMAVFQERLQQLSPKAAPALYWMAFCWGGALNMARDAIETLSALPRYEALLTRLVELDETYFYGAPHLLLAVYHASRAPMLGGQPATSKFHFERAAALSRGKMLIVPLLEAQYYAVQIQDRAYFIALLEHVLQASETLFPEQAFLNALAKQRAALLLARVNDLFV